MHIQFCEHGSRLYDFFRLFANKHHILHRRDEDKGYDDVCYTLFLTMLHKAQHIVEALERYYFPECSLFGNFTPYFYYADYTKEEDLLQDIAACDRHTLRIMILSSLLYNLKGISIETEADVLPYQDEIERSGIFSFLEPLAISNNTKWEYLSAWNTPEQKRDSYIALMTQLLPIFLEEYAPYAEAVRTYGVDLEKRLMQNGPSVITDMWKGIYDKWNNTEESLSNASYLFISIGASPLMSYGPEEGDKTKRPYIQGFHLEQGLQKLRQTRINNREQFVFFFKNLGDTTRFHILELIGQGIGTNKELAETLSLTTATVSYHLNYLFNANMITRTKKNGKHIITINGIRIHEILDKFLKKLENN